MSIRHVPCGSCARHHRITDVACPFCGHRAAAPEPAPRSLGRMSRTAALALGLAAGCNESPIPGPLPPDAATSDLLPYPDLAAAPVDLAPADASIPMDLATADGDMQGFPIYSAPPPPPDRQDEGN